MFDGSFKPTRKVNLSGRKKPAFGYGASIGAGGALAASASASAASSKEELLEQSKRLREERLAHRQRSAASVKIQALFRRVATSRRVRVRVFGELEAQLATLLRQVDVRSQPLPTATLQGLLRQFLVAYGRTNDGVLASQVEASRLQSAQQYVVFVLLMSALKGGRTGVLAATKDETWLYQTTRMAEIALRLAVDAQYATPAEQATHPCVLLVDALTTPSWYAAAGVSSEETEATLSLLVKRLALRREFGTLEALRTLVFQHTGSTDRVAQIVCRLTALALNKAAYEANGVVDATHDEALALFARKVVLTPHAVASPLVASVLETLSNLSPAPSAEGKTAQQGRFWSLVLSSLAETTLTWGERAVATGNVLDLMARSSFSPAVIHSGAALLARIVSRSHIQWAFEASSAVDEIVSGAKDVEMDDDDEFAAATTALQAQLERVQAADDREREQAQTELKALEQWQRSLKTQWLQLVDTNFVRRVFDAVDDVQQLCAVYATLLLGLGRNHLLNVRQSFAPPPQALFSFLSAVSAESVSHNSSSVSPVAVVKRAWDAVKRATATAANNARGRVSDNVVGPLLVFNVVYSHMLLALDDETFYDRAWPFQLGDIAEIVAYLKQFIHDVCWNGSNSLNARTPSGSPSSPSADLFPVLTTAVKLFNQLYDRDCRRRFTADGAWLWPAMPVIKETVDLESMEGDLVELQALASLMGVLGSSNAQSSHARASLILTTIPQVFSFTDRVQLFEKLLDDEKRNMAHVRDEFSRAIHVRIKRDEIVDESFQFFEQVCEAKSPSILKSRIKITFINEHDMEEAGVDGGGVFKEYVDQLTKNAFSPEYGFFLATSEQLLYPNPAARTLVDTDRDLTDRFRFLGRVLGKALYEGILVEPQFAAFFLNKLLGKFNYIDDLHSLDPDLYRNLMHLKHYTGNAEDLSLTFSVDEMVYGQVVTRALVPGGANIPVTNENKIRYIHLLANYKLNVLSKHESAAFLRGFRDLIPAKWLQMFSPSELQTLIGGTANKIDVHDWQRHTMYGGGYHPSQRPIQWFWELVEHEFSGDDRAALLKFITSVSRQPLLGFGQLAPQICIHQVRIDDDERLPSSATCMNLLKLPTYSSKEVMKQKLLYAIRSNAGFDLS